MLGSKFSKLWVCRLGMLCGVFAMLVFVAGCPVPPGPVACTDDAGCADDELFCNGDEVCVEEVCDHSGTPCAETDVCNEDTDVCEECGNDGQAACDDSDLCTGDACVDGLCVFTAVDCGAEFCDPATGDCVECLADADCDDGDACTDDACVDGACTYTDVVCEAGEECVDGACMVVCTGDADCDDADACTDDTCVDGFCDYAATDCDDGLFCTGVETCDPATGCASPGDPCPAGEACDEANDDCTTAATCTVDADCDDGLFCTGTETCVGGFCTVGTNPCVAPAVCVEETDTCSTPGAGLDFTLDDDTLNGTPGDDVFTAGVGTLNPDDIAVGNGGDDVLNATVVGSTSDLATLVDIDTINFQTLNDATFDAANCAAISAYGVTGSSAGGLDLDNAEGGVDLSMGAGFADLLDVDFTGAGTDFTLNLNGPADGASFDCQDAGLDLDVAVAADSFLGCGVPGTDCFGGAGSVTVVGAGNLSLTGHQPADLANDGGAYDMDDFTGMLTVVPEADAASNYDFSTGGADELDGVDQVTIVDTETYAHTLTQDESDGTLTVDISEIDEDDSAGALTIVQGLDATDDDILTVILGGDGDGTGALTAATTEYVNIVSGGTTADAVANVTSASGAPGLDYASVTVTGDQDCDLGTVTTELVDSTALDAAAGLTMTAAAGVLQIRSGAGDDDITGSAGADIIDAAGGGDTINGAAGADTLTGGAGADTFQFDAAGDSGITQVLADDITDFVAGADGDVMAFDDTGGFALTGTADTLAFEIESDGAFAAGTNVFVIDTTAIADLFGGLTATETALDGLINGGAGAGGGIFIVYDATTDAVYAVYDDDVTADSGTGADLTFIVEMGLDAAAIADSGVVDLVEANFSVLP